jgi:hypothetical protein
VRIGRLLGDTCDIPKSEHGGGREAEKYKKQIEIYYCTRDIHKF